MRRNKIVGAGWGGRAELKKPSLKKSAVEKPHTTITTFTCRIGSDRSKELHGLRCLHDISKSLQTCYLPLSQLFTEKCSFVRVREMRFIHMPV